MKKKPHGLSVQEVIDKGLLQKEWEAWLKVAKAWRKWREAGGLWEDE